MWGSPSGEVFDITEFMTDDLPPPPRLGGIIRAARKNHRLTLEQVSERSGISKSMLSQVERGTVNPTFAVVWNLMQALGLAMSDLVDAASAEESVIDHMPAYSTPTQKSKDGRVTLKLLSPLRTLLPLEWYLLEFTPGGALESDAHLPGTYEHLTCLVGDLAVELGDRKVTGRAGDTLRYNADRPHCIRNLADHPASALLLVALPQQYDANPF